MQGMKLKAGESLVSMSVLPPQLAQQVTAAEGAAQEAEAAAESIDTPAAADEDQGPWLLLVTRKGSGKRIPLQDVPLRLNRGSLGVIGIKLNAGKCG